MMQKDYDIIVIGAGNAGLSAAATTSQYRLKTLLIDRNAVPGGCATSFCRGRFEFEPTLHELAGIGSEETPGSIRKMLSDYGIRINWQLEKNAFRLIVPGEDGFDLTMPAGVEAFCDALEAFCEGSRDSAKQVFELAEKANAALGDLLRGKTVEDDILRMASHTVKECLDSLSMPPKAQAVMTAYWSYLGAPADELNFLHYAVMLDMYINGTPALPQYRSHEISVALDHAIREHGGDILYNTEVTRLLYENGRVTGVQTADGLEYHAAQVLCSAFPDHVYAHMLPAEAVSQKSRRLTAARKPDIRFFCIYLGLDRSAEELGIHDYSIFLLGNKDSREQFDHLSRPEESVIIANCPNIVIPDASPEGTAILSLTCMLPMTDTEVPDGLRYRRWKEQLARHIIRIFTERTGINIRPHIEEIEIATPATFARYLGTPGGTAYGYHQQTWDAMPVRLLAAREEQDIPGLTFIGAHAGYGCGYSATYTDGHSAGGGAVIQARLAKRRAKPT